MFLGGLQELPMNVEHKWTQPPTGATVTVKYTDKRKSDEIIKKYRELHPQMEQITLEDVKTQ